MSVKIYPWTMLYPRPPMIPYWLQPRDLAVEAKHLELMNRIERSLPADVKRRALTV